MSTVNFFKSNNQFRSQHVKYNPKPQITYNNTTIVNVQANSQRPVLTMPSMPVVLAPTVMAENVTVNNKSGGWQSFFGGFLGSIAGGFTGKAIDLSSLSSSSSSSSSAAQSKSPASDVDKLKNLKTLFSKHTFVAEGDNKYTCKTPDGEICTGSYDEILAFLKNQV